MEISPIHKKLNRAHLTFQHFRVLLLHVFLCIHLTRDSFTSFLLIFETWACFWNKVGWFSTLMFISSSSNLLCDIYSPVSSKKCINLIQPSIASRSKVSKNFCFYANWYHMRGLLHCPLSPVLKLITFTCIVALVPSPLPFFPSLFVLDHQPGKVFWDENCFLECSEHSGKISVLYAWHHRPMSLQSYSFFKIVHFCLLLHFPNILFI